MSPPKSPPKSRPQKPLAAVMPAAPVVTPAIPAIKMADTTPQAPILCLYAVEGWGKTTLGAFAPKPLMICSETETGYQTLAGNNMVPALPVAVCDSWAGTLGLLDQLLAADPAPYQTIVFDALGGFEELCFQHVTNYYFDGKRGDDGFMAYHKGYGLSVTDWLEFVSRIERLRQRGHIILLLSHVKSGKVNNMTVIDFDQFSGSLHPKLWEPTKRAADAVLFGNFLSIVEAKNPKATKGRGIGGTRRVLYSTHTDGYDAKNRFGLPDIMEMPDKPEEMWAALWGQIRKDV